MTKHFFQNDLQGNIRYISYLELFEDSDEFNRFGKIVKEVHYKSEIENKWRKEILSVIIDNKETAEALYRSLGKYLNK